MLKMCNDCRALGEIVGEDPDEHDPWCRRLDGYPPRDKRFCPMVRDEFNRMNLPVECAFCDELMIDRYKDDEERDRIELLCEIHTCSHYLRFEEYEDKLANGEIA